MYVDDIKLAGKKLHINPIWKVLNKEIDLGEHDQLSLSMYILGVLEDKVK